MNDAPASPSRKRNSALEVIERLRKAEPDIDLKCILTFLYVCENEGLNVYELAKVTGFTEASASRASRMLLAPDAERVLPPATGLLTTRPSPLDSRSRLISLTKKGVALRDQLDEVIAMAHPIAAKGA